MNTKSTTGYALIMHTKIVCVRIGLFTLLICAIASTCFAQHANLQAARNTARWLNTVARQTTDGIVWPADPTDLKSVNTTLYSGTPGPILFFLELYRCTGEQEYLRAARAGADSLMGSIDTTEETGLYEGLAGIGFTLGEAYLITRDSKYRWGVMRVVEQLRLRARPAGKGIEWNDTTDVIAGASGTGLFLLWAEEGCISAGRNNWRYKPVSVSFS